MANTFATELMPRILAGALEVLREEVAFASGVNKDYSGAAGQIGQVVSVGIPQALSVGSVSPSNVSPAASTMSFEAKTVTIDQWKQASFAMNAQEAQNYRVSDYIPKQIAEAARSLAYSVNASLWALYKDSYGCVGTAATSPFATNVTPVADLRKVLNDQLCPDNGRLLLIGHDEENDALKLEDLRRMMYAGDASGMRRGNVGELYGFQIKRDIQRPTHTAGTITTGLAAKTSTAQAVGDKTIVCTTAAVSGACALLKGDIITFAGHSQTYVLTANATQASAATDVTLNIEPGLKTALAGDEAVTVKATHKVNLAFDPSAFALVMRTPPSSIEGAPTMGIQQVMVDPKSGIPLKLAYYPQYEQAMFELSVLYGCGTVDARRMARLIG